MRKMNLKEISKKLVSAVVTATLFASILPNISAFAQINEPDEEVYVCDTQITRENCNDVFADGTVQYDFDSNTLTLNKAKLESQVKDERGSVIDTNQNITINLIGDNSICSNLGKAINSACSSDDIDAITITGTGKLDIASMQYGIFTQGSFCNKANLSIHMELAFRAISCYNFYNSGNINIDSSNSWLQYGIYTSNNFVQESGTISINDFSDSGIYAKRFNLKAGKVECNRIFKNEESGLKVISNSNDYYNVDGVRIMNNSNENDVIISGGELNINLVDEKSDRVFVDENSNPHEFLCLAGIYCLVPVKIDGGKVNINCISSGSAYGLSMDPNDFDYVNGDLKISVDSLYNGDKSAIPFPLFYTMNMLDENISYGGPTVSGDASLAVSKDYNGSPVCEYDNKNMNETYKYMHIFKREAKTVESVKSTCTKNGSKEYYMYDDDLGKVYFSDKECKNEIKDINKWLESDGLIPATGHSYKNGVCEYCNEKEPSVKPDPDKTIVKVGDKLKDKSKSTYVVTNAKKKEVAFSKPANKKAKSISVPATIKVDGVSYKVVKVADKAFAGCKKLTKVTIGKNVTAIGANSFKNCAALTKLTIPAKVTKIGANTFAGCKKLKNLTIKNTKLKAKNLNKKAFSGLTKKTTIKVAKAKVKSYKKMFKKKGLSTKVAVKGY